MSQMLLPKDGNMANEKILYSTKKNLTEYKVRSEKLHANSIYDST